MTLNSANIELFIRGKVREEISAGNCPAVDAAGAAADDAHDEEEEAAKEE